MLHRSEIFERQSRGASHSTLRLHPRGQTLPAELLRVDAQSPQNEVLRYAADFLARGCVVGIPTDTFYALAADPFNLAAEDSNCSAFGRVATRGPDPLAALPEQPVGVALAP